MTKSSTMIRTYRYRLLPTRSQHAALADILESQRILYNAALEERIGAYRATGRGRTLIDQQKALTECRRDIPEMAALPANLQRWTLKRVDDAFSAFFRRCKAGAEKAGFPRFRGRGWWGSFGFAEFSGVRLDDGRLRFHGLPGSIRLHMHRPLPKDADVRSCAFTKDGRGWHVGLQVALPVPEKHAVETVIGVDLGLNVFAYCSDGIVIPNPRIARRAERKLRIRQRALARCRRGSNGRRKARERLRIANRVVRDTRNTWLRQQAAALVSRADMVVAEDLRVANMLKNHRLARSIADAGWSKFLEMVGHKAESAGVHFVTVDPRNTSQRCSDCGELVPKALAVRTHACPHCGLVLDRDWNAARNILQAAVVGRGAVNVRQRPVRRLGNISLESISN